MQYVRSHPKLTCNVMNLSGPHKRPDVINNDQIEETAGGLNVLFWSAWFKSLSSADVSAECSASVGEGCHLSTLHRRIFCF